MLKAVGIIPARYASTRLPGKALAEIGGRPMIRWVYERACAARCLERVIVATDDERIVEAVRGFGGEAEMTSPAHRSGTDRLAEVAAALAAEIIVNIQGDEPLLDPAMIEAVVQPFGSADVEMTTVAVPFRFAADEQMPSVVKVVVDRAGNALYFSRLPIPYARDGARVERLHHIGMYGYRRAFLLRYAQMEPTPLEQAESLEQLRALENGIRICVVRAEHEAIGVDTPEDLERVRAVIGRRALEQEGR